MYPLMEGNGVHRLHRPSVRLGTMDREVTGTASRRWQVLMTESEPDISVLVLGPTLSLVLPHVV